jgi:hypothetical protein
MIPNLADGVPNLDCMTTNPAELWELWKILGASSVRPVAQARLLFPTRPDGFVRATCDLRNYAANKATAMTARLAGNIDTALAYERICDAIYSRLPEYAKW